MNSAMPQFTLPLVFKPETAQRLHKAQQYLERALEKHGMLSAAELTHLRAELAQALAEAAGDDHFLTRLRDDIRPMLLHLTGTESDELLQLPWHLLAEGAPHLLITKGLPLRKPAAGLPELPEYQPDLPLPLKVLVMVAAPEDHSGAGRLSYEAEESILLDALSELMRSGEVEVDFIDGDLPNLEEALKRNRYHALYFSGHSVFKALKHGDAPEGYLLLEDQESMRPRLTPAADFARVLAADPARLPALVVLASCQSAQGSAAQGFRGVAHRLMQAGVPAVIGMGWSVRDFWATRFAGAFFRHLAGRRPLGEAYNRAIEAGREVQAAGLPEELPASQSLIPQLFFTQQVFHLVQWQGKSEKRLTRASESLLKKDHLFARKLKKIHALFGRADENLLFIGRRRERKSALVALHAGRSVLLRGQGGMGKTAMALHLAERMLAAAPARYLPLAFDNTNLSLESLCNALLHYLETEARLRTARTQAAALEKQWDKFFFLLEQTEKQGVQPLFILDNLESFQDENTQALEPHIHELFDYLLTRLGYPVICTGRYPLQEFDSQTLHAVDLNAVPLSDFRQKCLHLPDLRRLEVEGRPYETIITALHRALGGNYRSLEDFDELCRQNPKQVPQTLQELDTLMAKYADATLQKRAQDLFFAKLYALLSPAQQRALLLLAQFRRPVLPFAIEGQEAALAPAEPLLARTADLTLAERRAGEAADRSYYYAPPLVRDLLHANGLAAARFDHERAGAYHEKVDKDLNQENYADLEEAFYHYETVQQVDKVNETGKRLSGFYYRVQQFQAALDFARRAEAVAGEQTDSAILNRLGLIHLNLGEYDDALPYFQRNLPIQQQIGDRAGEGATLNNISQIYDARGDYDTALRYLEQSLAIQQQIGDRAGEGATLNNLATTAYAKGDYDTALRYLEQSLAIRQQIGDRAGEGATLNNISQIFKARGDYDTALRYLEQSLAIRQQIGDRDGIATSLTNIGAILFEQNQVEAAAPLLWMAFTIFQQIGSPNAQAPMGYLSAILEKIGQQRFEELISQVQ